MKIYSILLYILDYNRNINASLFGNYSDKICPLIVEDLYLRSMVDLLKYLLAYFSVIIVAIFLIPGIIGNVLSLVLLFKKRTDEQYDGIIHYYRIIFLMDLIVILISIPTEVSVFGFDNILKIKIWNLQSIMPCCKFIT